MAELLNPHKRSLYTGILRPPSGYSFDLALATTYSLDLPTLLTVPVNLLLFSSDEGMAPLADGIAMLEALRRISSRILVFCQEAQIIVPARRHILYGMLEPVVYEADSPRGGAFHPKIWLIRFKGSSGDIMFRLAVLSRNLTRDRSWDLSLVMEGEVGNKRFGKNRPLAKLVTTLPKLAKRTVQEPWLERLRDIAGEIMRVEFEIPEGFEDLSFHLLGLGKKSWLPGESDELVVISPFLSEKALAALAGTTGNALALISREEELAGMDPDSLRAFTAKLVLNEDAESVEEMDDPDNPTSLKGLHAKSYIYRKGWHTGVVIGSANATDAALMHGSNVEFLVELKGRHSKVGTPEDLLSADGLGDVLVPYSRPESLDEAETQSRRELEKALRDAKEELCGAGLYLVCRQEGDRWCMVMAPGKGFKSEMIEALTAWPVTLGEDSAVDASPLLQGKPVTLPNCAAAYLTGFIAFELVPRSFKENVRFVLNLPVEDIPEERNAAIVRELIAGRDGFLRYLMLLLGDLAEDGLPSPALSAFKAWRNTGGSWDDLPLLEELTLAACREPQRLKPVKELIDDLLSTPEGRDLIPDDFLSLWRVFEESCLKEEIRHA